MLTQEEEEILKAIALERKISDEIQAINDKAQAEIIDIQQQVNDVHARREIDIAFAKQAKDISSTVKV